MHNIHIMAAYKQVKRTKLLGRHEGRDRREIMVPRAGHCSLFNLPLKPQPPYHLCVLLTNLHMRYNAMIVFPTPRAMDGDSEGLHARASIVNSGHGRT